MVWVLVCVLVALFGLGFLLLHAREVVRKGQRLLTEIDDAVRRLEAAAASGGAAAPLEDLPAAGAQPESPLGPRPGDRSGGRSAARGEAGAPGRRTLPVPDQRR